MTTSGKEDDMGAFFVGLVFGGVFTCIIWAIAVSACTVPMSEAIKHKAAYYHPETGAFTWRYEENPHADE